MASSTPAHFGVRVRSASAMTARPPRRPSSASFAWRRRRCLAEGTAGGATRRSRLARRASSSTSTTTLGRLEEQRSVRRVTTPEASRTCSCTPNGAWHVMCGRENETEVLDVRRGLVVRFIPARDDTGRTGPALHEVELCAGVGCVGCVEHFIHEHASVLEGYIGEKSQFDEAVPWGERKRKTPRSVPWCPREMNPRARRRRRPCAPLSEGQMSSSSERRWSDTAR